MFVYLGDIFGSIVGRLRRSLVIFAKDKLLELGLILEKEEEEEEEGEGEE